MLAQNWQATCVLGEAFAKEPCLRRKALKAHFCIWRAERVITLTIKAAPIQPTNCLLILPRPAQKFPAAVFCNTVFYPR